MSSHLQATFRKEITNWLKRLPRPTVRGEVQRNRRLIRFGFPGGRHEEAECWEYRCSDEPLRMFFGFYENFTKYDLICRVVSVDEEIRPGSGATLQFNSDETVSGVPPVLHHHGRITVRSAITRARLCELFHELAPTAALEFGIAATTRWPVTIGSINNCSQLVDRLFLYAYGVEQAKRSLRGETGLPALGPGPVEESEQDEPEGIEGDIRLYLVKHRRREAFLREAKLAEALQRGNGRLVCEVPGCSFDFGEVYGAVGRGYAQVHHLRPLANLDQPEETRLGDLAVVCANCHEMIHRGGECRDLATLISSARRGAA